MNKQEFWDKVVDGLDPTQSLAEGRAKIDMINKRNAFIKQQAFEKEYERLAKITLEKERFEKLMARMIKPTIKNHMIANNTIA